MIPEKIYFQKSYQVGEFLYEHYGMLGTLEPNETVDEAYDKARAETFRQHQRNNPQIKWHEGEPVTQVRQDHPKPSQEEGLAEAIAGCTNMKFLKVYESAALKFPVVKEAYDKKFAELNPVS